MLEPAEIEVGKWKERVSSTTSQIVFQELKCVPDEGSGGILSQEVFLAWNNLCESMNLNLESIIDKHKKIKVIFFFLFSFSFLFFFVFRSFFKTYRIIRIIFSKIFTKIMKMM